MNEVLILLVAIFCTALGIFIGIGIATVFIVSGPANLTLEVWRTGLYHQALSAFLP